jgi:uncharacterized protein (DUF302 family)
LAVHNLTARIRAVAAPSRAARLLAGTAVVALGVAACSSASSSGSSSSPPAASAAASGAASAPSPAAVTAKFMTAISGSSFSSTVAALKHAVASNGMIVLGSLDQAKVLSMTGLSLQGAETFFIGNPATGKMFFQADPAAGMAVPVSMYVWGTSSGGSEIGYFNPGPLFSALNSKLSSGGQKLSMMASQIAKAAS